jgi:RNA polymerase sigma-70 factor (ECF subfamily)
MLTPRMLVCAPLRLSTTCALMPMGRLLRNAIPAEGPYTDQMAEFVELYSGNYPRLQYYVMTLLPGANDVADVLQETSLVLWRKFDTFERGTNFFAWACKIARLQAMKHRERQGRSAKLFELHVMELLADEAGDEDSGRAAPLPVLRGCLEKLSEQERSLILRRYTPGMSVKILATEIGRSANSLSHTLGRIRRSLLECIKRSQAGESRG